MLTIDESFKWVGFLGTIYIPKKWIDTLGWKYQDLLELRIVKNNRELTLAGGTIEDYIEDTGFIPDFSDYIVITKIEDGTKEYDDSIVKKLGKGNRITISRDMQYKCNIDYQGFIELMIDEDDGFISVARAEEVAS